MPYASSSACASLIRSRASFSSLAGVLADFFTKAWSITTRLVGRVQKNTRPIPSLDFKAQLEQALAHRPRVGPSQVRAEGEHTLGEVDVLGLQARRELQDRLLYVVAGIDDLPLHAAMLTNPLTAVQAKHGNSNGRGERKGGRE